MTAPCPRCAQLEAERDALAAYVRKLQVAVRSYSFCAKDECFHYGNQEACCATFEDMLALLPPEETR